MKHINRINGARCSALVLAAAITVAGALGLTTASENKPQPREVTTYVPAKTTPAIDDPALMLIGDSCEHHC